MNDNTTDKNKNKDEVHSQAKDNPQWREGRRLRAWELHEQGWSQTRIAAALGVEPNPDSSSAGSEPGGRQPVAQTSTRGRRPTLPTASQSARSATQVGHGRAKGVDGATAPPMATGRGHFPWLCWRGMDARAHRPPYRRALRSQVPPLECRAYPAEDGLQPTDSAYRSRSNKPTSVARKR
jgi:hypothetical protein